MREYEQALQTLESDLKGLPSALPKQYRLAIDHLRPHLTDDQLDEWSRRCMALTGQSVRSWEAAGEYLHASPNVFGEWGWDRFLAWSDLGAQLAAVATGLGTAFFRASNQMVGHVTPDLIEEWADLGKQLYKGTWKSGSLAGEFLDLGPRLLPLVSLSDLRTLVRFLDDLANRSHELSIASLQAAPNALQTIDDDDRGAFLGFAATLTETSWADVRPFMERGPGLLNNVHEGQRQRFLDLARSILESRSRSEVFRYFAEASRALGEVEREDHGALIEMAEAISRSSGIAAMSFLKSTPAVLDRIAFEDIDSWRMFGMQILQSSTEGGEAYFRLESGKGAEVLEALSSRVELSRIADVLKMYCKAISGSQVAVQASSHLAEKNMGWVSENAPTTEGSTVFLPDMVETFGDKKKNFGVYKVYATHQVAHLEFGSFGFTFEGEGVHLPNNWRERARRVGTAEQVTEVEQFFDLFEDRRLVSDLFRIVEDSRVDQEVFREYRGIREPYGMVQEREIGRRPDVETMPLQTAFVENLIRASLGAMDQVRWPEGLTAYLAEGLGLIDAVQRQDATVEDSAAAVTRLYDIIYSLPNLPSQQVPGAGEWGSVGPSDVGEPGSSQQGRPQQEGVEGALGDVAEDQKSPYLPPPDVDFRGDFKPELVQLLMKLKGMGEQKEGETSSTPLSAEQLKELLEKNVEFEIGQMDEGDLANSSGMFITNLMKEADELRRKAQQADRKKKKREAQEGEEEDEDLSPLIEQPEFYYYDEWDFRANDYKPNWCCVQETVLKEGTAEFFEKTLDEHAALVAQTRRQFEQLKPEMFRKIKKLDDGEDFDLDLAVDFIIERRVGMSPVPKIYTRRNKIERDVAVAFLLDMSASTDEEINRRDKKDEEWEDDARAYLQKLAERRAAERAHPPKRIIDIERESTVVLIKALEAIGDTYGIYGFSGYGRDAVEFFVIKDLAEQFNEVIKRRIDKITPIRSTRMGAAIRHAVSKLDDHIAKVKILFLVSDGRPQDHGYGRDRTEKDYAIHDTKQALAEARMKGITPFCLTVDRNGHDYLKTMCEDMAYEVVSDIETLPQRIPTLYRMLTK